MSKRFDIHEWQAKRRKQRLDEDFRLEPEDMDNPDEDLVIIGSGYLDWINKFKERPSQTNGEYAAKGQKVVDNLAKLTKGKEKNGDKEAALNYIYKKINETDDYQKRQDALTPGKNPKKFYGDFDKLRGSMAANELSHREVMTVYNNFMDTHKYKETVIDDPDGTKENATLKIDTEDGESYEVLTSAIGNEKWWRWGFGPKSRVNAANEHHEEGTFPEVDQKTKDYLDKLKSTDKAGYNAVEDYIKAMNEMSSTGGGASFNAGNSMAHLGKKKKK